MRKQTRFGNSRRFFYGLVVILLTLAAGRHLFNRLAPRIEHVPIVATGDTALHIDGSGFGRSGAVLFQVPDEEAVELVPARWTPERIEAPLPQEMPEEAVVQVIRKWGGYAWKSNCAAVARQAAGLPSRPHGYATPVAEDSPWPVFRRDHRNSGRSEYPAVYRGEKPWVFATGKGIFSTPVIDGENTIYIGSADQNLYAIGSDGTEKWKFRTQGIIDSGAALHRPDERGIRAITFISGDGKMYHVSVGEDGPRVLWTFDAATAPGAGYINWWEGNVAMGHDGTLYAGNTNWNYYAIRPDGSVRWQFPTGNNCWSLAAFGEDGTIFWGSLDGRVRAIGVDGREKWSKHTWGMVAASAAVGSDGTLYIGSFDSHLYAIEPVTGRTKWTFKTGDHIYSSAALGCDRKGQTNVLYFGSTDGKLYAVDTSGRLRWAYDTGDPIRSSPVIGGPAPGETSEIVYVGSGNGRLYAVHASDGIRRWSYDTTPEGGEYRDRNDLNGSPALGKTGIYIGGEHGNLCYIPYDYPLFVGCGRSQTRPGEEWPGDGTALLYVTPGGTTEFQSPPVLMPSSTLTFRLVVREAGKTADARMRKDALRVDIAPKMDYALETSADGHYVHVRPNGFWTPSSTVTVTIAGRYFRGGLSVGNLTVAPHPAGDFHKTFSFAIAAIEQPVFPMRIEENRVSAFEWTRLAVALPTMMPSLNQIGFDYFDCIVSAVDIAPPGPDGQGKAIFWMTGGILGEDGLLRASPQPDFMMPLNGVYLGEQFILHNAQFRISVLGLPIPFSELELRGALEPDLSVKPGAVAYAEADALSIPDYGPLLVLSGLANDMYKKLVVQGTYVTRAYDERGGANQRPVGVAMSGLMFTAPSGKHGGKVEAQIQVAEGFGYVLAEHCPAILLVDEMCGEAVMLDYLTATEATSDAQGTLTSIILRLPGGFEMPAQTTAIVLLDGFPVARARV